MLKDCNIETKTSWTTRRLILTAGDEHMWEPEWMTLKTNLNYTYKWLDMKKSSVYIPFFWLLLCYCNKQKDMWAPVKLYINIRMCTLKFWPPRWSRQREMARIYNIWIFRVNETIQWGIKYDMKTFVCLSTSWI